MSAASARQEPKQSAGAGERLAPMFPAGRGLCLACVPGLLSAFAWAQAPPQAAPTAAPSPTPGRPSLLQIYCHFLDFQLRLDQIADDMAKEGKDASDLRTNFQHMLGFSDEDFAVVRSTALRVREDVKEIDAQALEARRNWRALTRQHLGEPEPRRLPPPPEVVEERARLQKQWASTIENEIAAMKAALGPEKAARLDAFMQQSLAPKTEGRPLTPSQLEDLRRGQPVSKGAR